SLSAHPATTGSYTLSLHDALPISILKRVEAGAEIVIERDAQPLAVIRAAAPARRTISQCIALAEAHEKEIGQAPELDPDFAADRSEEHTSELQSRFDLVCRLLLEK